MTDDVVYLDYNATTPIAAEVIEAMDPYLREHFGNPSSGHAYGRPAREGLDRARARVADLLGADTDEVVFTGSGTESNNLAIRGATEANDVRRLAVSAIEHPAVTRPAELLDARGLDLRRIDVDADGRIRLDELERALEDGVELVSIMHANNEMGAVQPIREAADLADAHGALFHTDASQTVGKIDVDVDRLGVDLLTVAGHKLYAPKGIGALYVRDGVDLSPVLRGASHEGGLRPGTENVAGAVGLGRACALADDELAERGSHMRKLRERLWRRCGASNLEVERHGDPETTLPNTLNMRFEGRRGDRVLERADGVAASTGSACHEGGAVEPSGVLTAMGVDPEAALGAIRLSVGAMTTVEEIDRAADELVAAARSCPD